MAADVRQSEEREEEEEGGDEGRKGGIRPGEGEAGRFDRLPTVLQDREKGGED